MDIESQTGGNASGEAGNRSAQVLLPVQGWKIIKDGAETCCEGTGRALVRPISDVAGAAGRAASAAYARSEPARKRIMASSVGVYASAHKLEFASYILKYGASLTAIVGGAIGESSICKPPTSTFDKPASSWPCHGSKLSLAIGIVGFVTLSLDFVSKTWAKDKKSDSDSTVTNVGAATGQDATHDAVTTSDQATGHTHSDGGAFGH